jgi:hypothetical protein
VRTKGGLGGTGLLARAGRPSIASTTGEAGGAGVGAGGGGAAGDH